MSIPLTASERPFTPAILSDVEGAPSFTFRDATVLDRNRFHELCVIAKIRKHHDDDMREVVLHELQKLFQSDGMAQNITRLKAYWQAIDDLKSANEEWRKQVIEIVGQHEGEGEPELPPQPQIEFSKGEQIELDALVDQVVRHSDIYAGMVADNVRWDSRYPRLNLRMFLQSTSLDVELKRDAEGVLKPESAEAVIEALAKETRRLGRDVDGAIGQLMLKALLSFSLDEDEEKNSSSPRSDTTPQTALANTRSNSTGDTSNDPVTSVEDSGSNLSASETPVSA